MGQRLAGKVALVTGGARGIGRATALVFAREGAEVVVNYVRHATAAREVVEAILDGGGSATALGADVANPDQVSRMFQEIEHRFTRLDILVNNAGLWRPGRGLTMDGSLLDDLWSVNLKGALNCAQLAAPLMNRHDYGRIVNVSSVAGLAMATPDNTPYTLTKSALIALTKRLALELGPTVTVNAVCPGLIATDMMEGDQARHTTAGIVSRTILGRAGTPAEVANAILFLASEEASFVTAQALTVDGGRTDFVSRSG
ncbi:glucose 1-dehydrogenase [Streptomyces sp. NPDC007905]|uniref:SDR family NAD(P)-dependent oxidoreductase n=1 Tax=Streptomyces sp. NPDC007905 TaxID=3364788 RepID=UPI0036F01DC4